MPKRYVFTKSEKFTGWLCNECGWEYKLPLNPSDTDLAAAEKALQDHLAQEHHEIH